MPHSMKCALVPIATVVLASTALAATGGPAAAPSAPPTPSTAPACGSPECRQFDFWLGTWDVFDPTGHPTGTNVITSELGGCVLQEHWSGAGGGSGTSFNLYDAPLRRWHQTWVDSRGGLILLDGTFSNGKMVLEGDRPSRQKPGTTVHHRITWAPLAPDTVTQRWESTSDGGKTWAVQFDGRYVRRK